MKRAKVILASASPRRAELLDQIGVTYSQFSTDIDESQRPGELVVDYVSRLALEKAESAYQNQEKGVELPALGADTVVVIGDKILGKPVDEFDALDMLQSLSGKQHKVITAVAFVSNRQSVRLSITDVWFRTLTKQECLDYWRSGEPADKAGSYAIQGTAAIFIERIEGSYSGVMGLPLFETAQLLRDFNIPTGI